MEISNEISDLKSTYCYTKLLHTPKSTRNHSFDNIKYIVGSGGNRIFN